MIHKVCSSKPGYVRVVFELPACTWADHIFVTGDFNGWDKTATPLRQERDGVWRAMLDLCAGSCYEFRYLIDGHWSTDYHADGCTTNRYGSENSIVIAELPTGPMHANHRTRSAIGCPRSQVHCGGTHLTDLDHGHLDVAA